MTPCATHISAIDPKQPDVKPSHMLFLVSYIQPFEPKRVGVRASFQTLWKNYILRHRLKATRCEAFLRYIFWKLYPSYDPQRHVVRPCSHDNLCRLQPSHGPRAMLCESLLYDTLCQVHPSHRSKATRSETLSRVSPCKNIRPLDPERHGTRPIFTIPCAKYICRTDRQQDDVSISVVFFFEPYIRP